MPAKRTTTKILVDGGDPEETSRIKQLLGFVDGQTTNPSLIAKNPEIRKLVASGHPLSRQEENEEYKRIVQRISPLVGDAGVSIEVLPISTAPPSRCWSRVRKCSLGYRMHISNIPAPRRVCEPHKCLSTMAFA
jgi:hypothetical protein